MKPLFTLLFAFLMAAGIQTAYSQTISFGYDAAGNRISRTIVIQQVNRAPAAPTGEPEVFSEMLSDLVIKIYPNPTDGILKVEIENLPEGQEAILTLYNLSGNRILQRTSVSGTEEMNISNQQPGTYILRILAGEHQTEWKIIKK